MYPFVRVAFGKKTEDNKRYREIDDQERGICAVNWQLYCAQNVQHDQRKLKSFALYKNDTHSRPMCGVLVVGAADLFQIASIHPSASVVYLCIWYQNFDLELYVPRIMPPPVIYYSDWIQIYRNINE